MGTSPKDKAMVSAKKTKKAQESINSLGTACGKYFRVSCLSILDAGKPSPLQQFTVSAACRESHRLCWQGGHQAALQLWTAAIRGAHSELKNPWGAVCESAYLAFPPQVTPTFFVLSSKRCDEKAFGFIPLKLWDGE